jgi:hypothetical protein
MNTVPSIVLVFGVHDTSIGLVTKKTKDTKKKENLRLFGALLDTGHF